MHERRNSIADAQELCLSCTKPSIYGILNLYDRITFCTCQTILELKWLALTHWGRVTHKCVSKLTIIGSDNGLSPGRHQAIIWTNTGILLIGPLGTNNSEIVIVIYTFSFEKIDLKMLFGKGRPSCLGLSVLIASISFLDSTYPELKTETTRGSRSGIYLLNPYGTFHYHIRCVIKTSCKVSKARQCFEIPCTLKYGIKAALLLRYLPNFKPIYFDGLVQERRNSSALAMELRLRCTKPSICIMIEISLK